MPSEPPVNILLVDDQPANLLALEAMLEGLGQNLIQARSGTEALRYLLAHDFALILMDVRMPDMDGLETAALIRGRDRSRHTPIIFLTAYGQTDLQMIKGYALGAVDYLVKPVVPEILRSKVAVFVELYRKTEQVRAQAELLRETQQREHERRLQEERQRWEMDRLRREAAREKRISEELARAMAERLRAEERARERARQQAFVAELGQRALATGELETLRHEAVRLVSQALEVAYCRVHELLPDGTSLELRTEVGRQNGALRTPVADALARRALHTGEPVIVEDVQEDPHFRDDPLLVRHGVVSGMAVAILGEGRPLGTLSVQSTERRSFSRDDAHFLQAIAHVLGTAEQRTRFERSLQQSNDRLRLLSETASALLLEQEPHRLIQELFRKLSAHLGLEVYLVYLVQEPGQTLRLDASAGVPEEIARDMEVLAFGQGVSGLVAQTRSCFVVQDGVHDQDPRLDLVRRLGMRAYACFPLLAQDRLMGTLSFGSRRRSSFGTEELALLQTVSDQVAMALDRARLIEELRQRAEALAETDRRKDEFLAMLAHELRNPLAPVLNALHIMRLSSAQPEVVQRAREMAERQIRHMARLVEDLLDVSRITRGKIQLRKERIDFAGVVARSVESCRSLVESRGHTLEVGPLPEGICLQADPTRLEQVLANLLTNAAKYTDPGGRIQLHATVEDNQAVVRVRDTGVGISPEMLPRIFELFTQVDRSLDRAEGGLGIGLTLVRKLVEMHGGTVEARSEGLGKGSEFTIRLPISAEAPTEERQVTPEMSVAAGQTRRVLIVDDNRDAALSVGMVLELDGHEVRMVHNGAHALDAAAESRPDVILLDIGLPGMNGYEVARQLRQREELKDVLLVAMTGYGQAEDRRRSSDAGFDHHLVKPVDPAELQELLARPRLPV